MEDCWSSWVAGGLDDFLSDLKDQHYIWSQYVYRGGTYSRFRAQDPNDDMSFSWQCDSTFACTMDVFYDGGNDVEVKAKAKAWVDKNDEEGVGENGIFSKEDRRLLWGSRGTDLPANTHVLL